MKTNDEGFTLIELLIVIVILGILATVVVFSVRGITDQGKSSSCSADAKTLEVAIESYYAHNGNVATITETMLVNSNLLRAASGNYNINASGQVVAQTGGKCE